MKTANKMLVLGITFGLGMGTGLRATRMPVEPLKIQPIQSHTVDPDLKPCVKPEAKNSQQRIFRAVCLWEGRGRIDLDAINPSEDAHGPAQIRQGYLTDSGLPYTLQDCHDYEVSYRVACAYWARYGATTDEQRARSHNGGPRGPQRASTLGYWASVKKYLDN